jgi:hypothetical protein
LQVVLEKPLVPHSTHTQEEEALHEGNIPQN